MEIVITLLIGAFAVFILVKNLKKNLSGNGCDCSSCSSHCAFYKEANKDNKDKNKTTL